LIDVTVLEFMRELRKQDREFLMTRFEQIRRAPARHAEFITRDEVGRDLDNHIAGRFAITYWDDFADRHVKIMGVTWADGRAHRANS
jgi:hypothetical protein